MRPRRRATKLWTPRPSLQWALDAITTGPAIVRNGRMDLLATNHLGRAMHSSIYDSSLVSPPNFARYTFLDDDSHRFYPNCRGQELVLDRPTSIEFVGNTAYVVSIDGNVYKVANL